MQNIFEFGWIAFNFANRDSEYYTKYMKLNRFWFMPIYKIFFIAPKTNVHSFIKIGSTIQIHNVELT